jgi:hypothetical protein
MTLWGCEKITVFAVGFEARQQPVTGIQQQISLINREVHKDPASNSVQKLKAIQKLIFGMPSNPHQ